MLIVRMTSQSPVGKLMCCLYLIWLLERTVESCPIGVAFGQSSFSDLDLADDVSLLAELVELPCSFTGDDGKWGSICGAPGELVEGKGPSFGLQGGYAINH